ncbi:MAG: carbohydrate ABC transporter substrate-binding protein [Chloroflexi bacterium]|nr:MAG: carbohydrate ABC transporter substrate-binding protein [Chloroflexota bacterium]
MGDSRGPKIAGSSERILIPGTGIELPVDFDLSRRDMLKIAGYGSLAAFIAACGGTTPTTTSGSVTAKGGSMSIGSYLSDAVPKKGLQDVVDAFTSANGGTKVKVNTVDHGTFQNTINNYLQATPEDIFTWFSGHRMRFFAKKGLAQPIDDVWNDVKSNFTEGFAASVKGDDGHVYAVPTSYYPWAIFYRKDVFTARNYKIPTNWDDFIKLCQQMKKDNLIPMAFADWQEAAQQLRQKKAGMYLLGLFVSEQFVSGGNADDINQLDFFPFPDLGTQYDSEKALDAPIDVYMLAKKSPTLGTDSGQAKAFLEFMSKGSSQITYWKASPGAIPTANDADPSQYPALTKKAAQIVSGAKRITQFFDRDSRPDFSGPNAMQGFLLRYLSSPKQDTSSLQGQMQSFWDSLTPE